MRAPKATRARRAGPRTVSARLSAQAATRSARRRTHLRSASRAIRSTSERSAPARRSGRWRCARACRSPRLDPGRAIDREIESLVRRLARHGLLEYPVRAIKRDADAVVIEPQVPDYWPRTPALGNTDVLALSRFAYLRRRGDAMVLESPRAAALFRICDPKIASRPRYAVHAAAGRTAPPPGRTFRDRAARPAGGLPDPVQGRCRPRRQSAAGRRATPTSFCGTSTISCSTRAARRAGTPTRSAESYSICGRHACAAGGAAPLARRSRSICARSRGAGASVSPTARLLRERHSVRSFDDARPITLAELARFLDGTARVLSTWQSQRRPRRRPSGGRLCDAAVSVGGRKLRARALSGGRQMRRARARILSLRRRRARAGADRACACRSSKRC